MLSEMLKDVLRDLDSAEGWAESDKSNAELAADFEGFTLPSRAFVTSVFKKYKRDHLEYSLDEYYVRKALRDIPKLVQRTLQLESMATQDVPMSDAIFYLREATRCYIFGFWAASVALGRAALEQSLKEAVAKVTKRPVFESKLSRLVESAGRLRLADLAVLNQAEQVRLAGNRTVHNKASDQSEAWGTLVAVRGVMSALYKAQVLAIPEIEK